MFRVKIGISTTTLHVIKSGVLQNIVLGPIFYVIFTYDLPTLSGRVLIDASADDTVILSTAHNPHIASAKLHDIRLNDISYYFLRI